MHHGRGASKIDGYPNVQHLSVPVTSPSLMPAWQLCIQLPSTKDGLCDLCTPHTTYTSAYQHFSAKPVPVMHVVVHCIDRLWTSSLPVNSTRHFPAICLHERTCALWSHCDFLPAPHSRLFSDQRLPPLTVQHQLHHQPSSSPHWPIDTLYVCVLLIVCTFHYSQHGK